MATKPESTVAPADWRVKTAAWVLLIGAGILLPLLLELGLQLSGYGYPTEFLVTIPGRDAYTANQRFGWRFFPPPLARTPAVFEVPAHKAPKTYRIVILGESAAMGIPEPAFNFGRILRVMLERRYPGVKFEVINAAMTAINSHVIRPITADCKKHGVDLFVIYAGNNEVVGPYGAATVFTPKIPSLPMIRLGIWFKGSRTSQLLENQLARFRKPGDLRDWGGMAMFLDQRISVDDPRMAAVYGNFRRNLTDICRTAARSGAQVVLSTVGSNLKDFAPFVSLHRPGLSTGALQEWDALFRRGIAAPRPTAAVDDFLLASRIDDGFADLHFQLGGSYLELGRTEDARREFIRARDLDALRFRADSRINDTIRAVAADLASRGVRLVDAAHAMEASTRSGFGIPGDELFYEHVHLNFSGNFVIASAIMESLQAALPAWIREQAGRGLATTEDDAARALAFTGWNRYRSTADMFAMTEQPPFTNQFGYAVRREARKRQLAGLFHENNTPQALNEARAAYLSALERNPRDIETNVLLAQVISRAGDHTGSAGRWKALTLQVPGIARWHLSLGDEFREQHNLPDSLAETEKALGIDPQLLQAHFKLGETFEGMGKWNDAEREFRDWLKWRPADADAYNRLAGVLRRAGRDTEALADYAEAVKLRPDFAEAQNNWGVALQRLGQLETAIQHYSEAIRAKPDFAEAHTNWGVALAALGRPQEAIPHYEQALRIKPDLAAVENNLGSVLESTGQVRQAIPHYQKAVQFKPDFVDARVNWGIALLKLQRYRESAEHFQEALQLNPRDWQAHYYLGNALEAAGGIPQAIEQYQATLRLRPDYAPARERVSALTAVR